ncbi:MAG: lysine--tRNA ligase, partial [Anaplasmataceae bacterium]|nr:lysine--tRNA ligase [Anaplasmataceae bacterium]
MLEDLIVERERKLRRLREAGIDPYPAKTPKSISIADFLADFNVLAKSAKAVTVKGRIVAYRDQGGVIFFDLRDESSATQVVAKKEVTKNFSLWQEVLDRGDFVAVKGKAFTTKRGVKSIEAKSIDILSKALRPVPTTFYGLKDTEVLLRQRYLDLIANPELKELFYKKSKFWQATRSYLLNEGFLEVETPILEAIPGGAEAEPFITHYNALKRDFYLRISPELNLKRLMVGGFEKVFEIGRIFRNEGIDAEHLQDYTQMEMYWAYQDYEGLMQFLEKMVKKVIKETFGSLNTTYDGQKINWGKKWVRYDYGALFKKETGLELESSLRDLQEKAKDLKISQFTPHLGKGRVIDLIYKKTVRPKLVQPGFLINPPVEIEPLAKRMSSKNNRVERFQVVAGGTELGKGFSELNDPHDQRARFEEQQKLRQAGDKEAQMFDHDYVEAMEYGMPPVAG